MLCKVVWIIRMVDMVSYNTTNGVITLSSERCIPFMQNVIIFRLNFYKTVAHFITMTIRYL